MGMKGFTIIELMIVVALIGILSAIAIPMFGNYTAKAQASEGQYLLAGLKSPLIEAISNNGLEACSTETAWYKSSVRQGQFVDSIAIEKNETQCLMTVTFKSADINDKLVGKKINMRYTVGSGVWECGSDFPEELKAAPCQAPLLTLQK